MIGDSRGLKVHEDRLTGSFLLDLFRYFRSVTLYKNSDGTFTQTCIFPKIVFFIFPPKKSNVF